MEKSLEIRQDLLNLINTLPEDKLDDLKLIATGYIACCKQIIKNDNPHEN